MITLALYRGKTVGVFGLGKAGEATVAAFLAGGATVFAWDDSEKSRDALARAHPKAHIEPLASWPWNTLACVCLSPGVPYTHPAPHPVVHMARQANVEIVGDIELLFRAQPEAVYVGITGTNGKSTTTTLVAHILQSAKRRVEVGGNLGTPALALAPLAREGVYVLELSSYQLDLVRSTRFHVAALLNLTPDHLDRHGDMEGYLAAKMHIFDRQQLGDVAVVGVETSELHVASSKLQASAVHVVPVSTVDALREGISVCDGTLIDTCNLQRATCNLSGIPTLPGRHNWQNAGVAWAVARALGVTPESIGAALHTFPGLRHRLQLVTEVRGVRFVNDSKATNADATQHALAAYEQIYWILGGKPKEGGIDSLVSHFPRVRHAFLIGQAAEAFARVLEGRVPYTHCGTLDVAVAQAADRAFADNIPGAVVLLSPACASFDQFKSFEERGDRFCDLAAQWGARHAA